MLKVKENQMDNVFSIGTTQLKACYTIKYTCDKTCSKQKWRTRQKNGVDRYGY